MKFFFRLRKMPLGDIAMLAEALTLLTFARIALKLLPMRILGRFFGQAPIVAFPETFEASIRRVRWAVLGVARHAPIDFVCFPRAIAAQRMLRRRGIASTLYFGVARSEDGILEAHVWLMAVGRSIVGGETASRFRILKTFPDVPLYSSDPTSNSASTFSH